MSTASFTIQDFNNKFPDNESCLLHLFETHHGRKTCSKCGELGKYHLQKRSSHYVCSCGGSQISPKAGTIFEKSDTDLVKWFFAIFLMSQSRNGVSAKEIERQVGVTYKTAWRMQKQIRLLMYEDARLQSGEVEADETYIGGKIKGRKNRVKNKVIVFGSVERGGKVNTSIVPDTKDASLRKHLKSNVAKSSRLLTDEWGAYKKIARTEGYQHDSVNHKAKQYVVGTTHTNTIEGFWSQLKRSIDGTYHVVSPKYLSSYLSEFSFRYNHARSSSEHLFHFLLSRVTLPHVAAV